MDAPSEEARAPSIPSLSQRLDRAKDYAPLVVLVLGAIYAVGWMGESVAIEHQGVGMWEVSHQSAVTMGLLVLVTVMPLYIAHKFVMRIEWNCWPHIFYLYWLPVVFGLFIVFAVFQYVGFTAALVAYLSMLAVIVKDTYDRRLPLWGSYNPVLNSLYVVTLFLLYLYYFSISIVPHLAASLGGFPRNKVTIFPTTTINKPFLGELLGGDSDSIVIFDGEKNVRFSRKDINRIEGTPIAIKSPKKSSP